ncbi:MAG: DUF4861 family protein [bacterium]
MIRRMINPLFLGIFVFVALACQEEKETSSGTDASLFWKKDSVQVSEIISEEADQFQSVGHHGPAIENEYFALRMYFNNSGAIDVYSKQREGLELKDAYWYPDSAMQANGYGSDQYKVGETLGLGGIRLWDGKNVIKPEATNGRIARISDEGTCSIMEMIAFGVPYKNDTIDLLTRVSVFSGNRFARMDAFALCDQEVQFVTGINFHDDHHLIHEDGYVLSWGKHPEDVALDPAELGAAVCYDETGFVQTKTTENEVLLISKPGKQVNTYLTTASSKEKNVNTAEAFEKLLKNHQKLN